MGNISHQAGVSELIGKYSDAVEVPPNARWLWSAGTPGLLPSGELPGDIIGQSENVWKNIADILGKAWMGYEDLVKVNTTLTKAEYIADYNRVRSRVLGDVRPAFMLTVADQLIRPEFLVEVEIVAAKS